jgi:hypothetical protein
MTDREKLEQVAKHYRELEDLRARQAATQALMIRGCLEKLLMDPNTHNMRGHEGFGQRSKQIKKNRRDKHLAELYLIALATSLEDQALRLPETSTSIEGGKHAIRTTRLQHAGN